MKDILKYSMSWLMRILFILIALFFLNNHIILVSASPINFDQNHHTGNSEIYTYDAIENSNQEERDHSGRMNWAISNGEVRPDYKVLADAVRVAARTSTASWGKVFNYRHGGQMSAIEHIM